jgi:hypothetical protein
MGKGAGGAGATLISIPRAPRRKARIGAPVSRGDLWQAEIQAYANVLAEEGQARAKAGGIGSLYLVRMFTQNAYEMRRNKEFAKLIDENLDLIFDRGGMLVSVLIYSRGMGFAQPKARNVRSAMALGFGADPVEAIAYGRRDPKCQRPRIVQNVGVYDASKPSEFDNYWVDKNFKIMQILEPSLWQIFMRARKEYGPYQ